MKTLYIAIIIVVIIGFLIYFNLSENFESCGEKAKEIHKWFGSNKTPSYNEYRSAIDTADIVEYHDLATKYRKNGASISLDEVNQTLGCTL